MTAKADKFGNIFRDGVASFNSPIVQKVRGKGLLNAIVIDESAANGRSAWDLCLLLKEKGLLVSLILTNILPSCLFGVLYGCNWRPPAQLGSGSSPPILQVPLGGTICPTHPEQPSMRMWRTNMQQAKPTHGNIIRFAPPLVITEAELSKSLNIIGEALKELPSVEPAAAH